ncbi:MAG: hypothetical protein ACLUIE_01065 [Parabacteroides merdae]
MPAARFRCLSRKQHYRHQVVAVTVENGCLSDVEAAAHPTPNRLASDSGGTGVACRGRVDQLAGPAVADQEEGDDRSSYGRMWRCSVLLTEPDPGFRHRVEEALADKAVRLTSIIPSYPKKEGEEDSRPLSYNGFANVSLRWICFATYLYQ